MSILPHYHTVAPRALPLQFYFNVHISHDDYVRLGSNLATWEHLNELLILGVFDLDDLKRLLILELAGHMRKQVLLKLRSRILTAESKHIQTIITNALTPPSAPDQDVPQATQRHQRRRLRKAR